MMHTGARVIRVARWGFPAVVVWSKKSELKQGRGCVRTEASGCEESPLLAKHIYYILYIIYIYNWLDMDRCTWFRKALRLGPNYCRIERLRENRSLRLWRITSAHQAYILYIHNWLDMDRCIWVKVMVGTKAVHVYLSFREPRQYGKLEEAYMHTNWF